MADNIGVTPGAGKVIATDDVGGTHYQVVKLDLGGNGLSDPVDGSLPVDTGLAQPLTDTQLRATALPVSGPLTDAQLRATDVPVDTGLEQPLTDAQIRATALPVSGPLTDTQLRATALPVSGPLTDTQLRATALPVSGPLTDAQLRATDVPVDTGLEQPLTDAQIRATALPVSGPLTDAQLRATALALPTGAATAAHQVTAQSSLGYMALAAAQAQNDGVNICPDLSTWTLNPGATRTPDYGASVLPGRTTFRLTATIALPNGASTMMYLAGRTEGTRWVFSVWAKGTGNLYAVASCRDASDRSDSGYIILGALSATWKRFYFPFVVNLSNANRLFWQLYTGGGTDLDAELDGLQVEQTENTTPSRFFPAVARATSYSGDTYPWVTCLPVARSSVSAWGDSLVNGASGIEFRTELARILNNSAVSNQGIGGETSTQVRDRMVPVAWVGSTAYTLGQYRYNGANIYKVTTGGTSASSGGPTGTGTGISDGTVTWAYYGLVADVAVRLRYGVVVIWVGRNDLTDPDLILSNIEAMVAAIPHGRWLIVGVMNSMGEPAGSPAYGWMQVVNSGLRIRYGSRFVDVRGVLAAGEPGDMPAPRYMQDGYHPNGVGHGISAHLIATAMRENGFLPWNQPTRPAFIPTTTAEPFQGGEPGQVVRLRPSALVRCSFSDVASGLVSKDFRQIGATGTGMTISQSAGNLVVVAGTTANAEFLAVSRASVRGGHALRTSLIASARIAQNNLSVEVADLIGEGLAYSITNATTVVVTFASGRNRFTSYNAGQFLNVSAITGAAGIPGRFAIASVTGDTITLTVAGWPASGSGTLCLWGWNYHRVLFNGTTKTQAAYDAQRRGWASGDSTATIVTTDSPGVIVHLQSDGTDASISNSLRASNAAYQFTTCGSRVENLPDPDVELFAFIRCLNGTTNPAGSTTFTVGFVHLENLENVKVYLAGMTRNGAGNAVSVQGAVTASGTVTANIGTGALAAGTNAIGDVGIQYRANATGAATATSISSPATPAGGTIKGSAGRLLGLSGMNTAAATRFLKIFNATTVTMGSTSALFEIPIPAGQPFHFEYQGGLAFSTGIMWAVTSARGLTDNTTTGLAAGDVTGFSAHA
jgi:hypothetical protein